MNALDRIISYVSPNVALNRMKARFGIRFLHGGAGGYDAGTGSSKELERWSPPARSPEADIHPGLDTMRGRTRDMSRNNPIAAGAIDGMVVSSIGGGLTAQPNIDREFLGLTDEKADKWEARLEMLWTAYADSTECDIEGETTFGELQAIAFRSVLESGDVLRLRRFTYDKQSGAPRDGERFATKIQLVEADRITNPQYMPDNNRVAGGVEVDENGRVVAYHVQTTHPGETVYYTGAQKWTRIPTRDPNTGMRVAKLMVSRMRVGQRRGVPLLAPVVRALKQVERYTHSELMAAVISSYFTVFVKSEAAGEESPLGMIQGEDAESTTGPGELQLGAGLINDLAPGESIEFANPARPNAQFDPFVMSILRQIGMAIGVPYEVLIKHFSASYSASRGAILEAYKTYQMRRQWLVRNFCAPAYADFVDECVARGMIEAPEYFTDPMVRDAYLRCAWSGAAVPQIDPLKEANAAKVRIDTGVSTIDREARETNGSSFLANHDQRAKEARMRREAGLDVEVVQEGIKSTSVSRAITEEEDDSEDDDMLQIEPPEKQEDEE